MPRILSALLAASLLTGCNTLPHRLPESPSTKPTATAKAPPSRRGKAATQSSLDQARQAVAQPDLPANSEASKLLKQAEQAAEQGNHPRAQSLAREAASSAEQELDAQRTREAAAELKVLYDTTGLSDKQLEAMRAAESELIRGDSAAALTRLKALRQEAAHKTRGYTVKRGDTLSDIAARDDVYGNSLLWPLIWQANRKTLPDPNKLRAGQKLVIRVSPTVEEVVQAIRIARRESGRLSIGEVLEVLP